MIYDTGDNKVKVHNGTSFSAVGGASAGYYGFSCDKDGDLNVTSAGTTTVSAWRSTATGHFNSGHFVESTGIFTAPVTGIYQANAAIRLDGTDSGYFRLTFFINNTQNDNGVGQNVSDTFSSSFETWTLSSIVKLTANDTFSLRVISSSDTTYKVQSESAFNMFILHAL